MREVRDEFGSGRSDRTAARLWLRRSGVVVGLLALGASLACANPRPAPQRPGATETYRVGPPDQLFVSVLPEPVIERTLTVRPDGKISIDLVGDVQAGGRTVEEIAKEVEQRVSRYKRDARVTVSVALARSSAVTVLGEVRGPTSFALEKDTRVVEAIGRVGGPTQYAAKSRIRVVRAAGKEPVVFWANLDAIQNGDLTTNILLMGGDIIFVPPTIPARIGYAIAGFFYPFQQLLGFGGNVATTVITGGV